MVQNRKDIWTFSTLLLCMRQTWDWWESGGKSTGPVVLPPPPPPIQKFYSPSKLLFCFSGVVIDFGRCSAENGAELEKKKGES